ncbi:MAG: response regulator, partial [Draconibacterium sp.]
MKRKVAIADDHKLFIDGIKSIFTSVNTIEIVAEAANGVELIQALERGVYPDIIITDIRMPVMDGITATRFISKAYPNIPILALSMYDQCADVIEMLEAGAKGYITKDIEKCELLTAIKKLMRGEKYYCKNLPQNIQNWQQNNEVNTHISLTRREKEILELISRGRTTLQIARELKLSKFTVDTHRKNIHKKLGIKTNTGLVNYAHKNA